jgi:hypothetical protein
MLGGMEAATQDLSRPGVGCEPGGPPSAWEIRWATEGIRRLPTEVRRLEFCASGFAPLSLIWISRRPCVVFRKVVSRPGVLASWQDKALGLMSRFSSSASSAAVPVQVAVSPVVRGAAGTGSVGLSNCSLSLVQRAPRTAGWTA